nr:MAG: hypothetical protein 2 [Enamovirus sp.]
MANSTAFIILAFFSWFLLPSVGQPLPQFGTSLDAGSNQYQAGTLSLVVPPLLLRDLEFTPPDSDYVWPSRSDEDQEEKPSRSKHTGQSQIVYTWTWPSWNCSNSQCLIVISIPSWRWTLQRLESLAREWDLLSTYQHFSGLLIQIPGFTLHCAGETLIYLATLIEYVLVSWNACLYYVLSHVVKAIPGQVAVSVALLSLASWVWPKQILSYVISICAFPLISTRYGTSILRWVVSQCFSWTWSITTIWLTLPWTILMMISQTMVNIVLKKKKTKKVSKKSLKAKLKIAKATKKRTIKAPSSPTEERTIPGVSVKKLREDPPPGLILRCSDSFGQHIGYASAIKLEDKQTGILLPIHVWKDSTTISGPNGKLPLTNFQPIYDCISHDSLIMTSSSAGWGSILGARPRPLETIEAVRLKNYSLFTERDGPLSAGRDGKWFVQAARFIAPANGMFRVVSDTAPGDSGLPLLDMKMNVVAMHRGCWPESSGFPENRCVAILPVPGLTCPSSPKFTGCESYTETEAAYDMSEGFSDGEEVVVRTKGYDYNTYVGASRIATLKVSTLERELRKGPIGLWYHSDEDESATRSGNGSSRSTPAKQSPHSSSPAPSGQKVEESAAVTTSPSSPPASSNKNGSQRTTRRSEMTPEQKRADNQRRRRAKSQKKQKPPLANTTSISIPIVKDLIDQAVKAALSVKPRRSNRFSKASTGGVNQSQKHPVLTQLEPAPSQSSEPPQRGSPSGVNGSLRPHRSLQPAQKSTAGPTQGLQQN